MSKVIKKVENRSLAHIVETNDGRKWYVDSTAIPTTGGAFETMVFEINERGEVLDWGKPVYIKNYLVKHSMVRKHNYLLEHLEEFIK